MIPRFLPLVVAAATAAAFATSRAGLRDGPAFWVGTSGPAEHGLRSLSGGDGVTALATAGGAKCLTTQAGTSPASSYLYFALDSPGSARGPIYVSVEYFDSAPGIRLALEYDSATGEDLHARYLPAEDQAGGWSLGTKRWKRAIFQLDRPRFGHRQNLGADFRLTGPGLWIRSVAVFSDRPADWLQADQIPAADLKPLVAIGPGCQLIVGGFDPAKRSDAIPQSKALESAIPALKQLGVTSHEGYVRWNLCEPQPGKFDWSVYDRFVDVYKRHGLKWVPFLIAGSAYSLPDWFYHQAGSQGYVCLEHGQESDVQSLWNPALREHVRRFIRAFCDHYRDSGVIESILLGVTGNYGEAIYPVTGNDWTADIHGPYHSHPGFWAGDKYATDSFQLYVARKYGGPEPFRDAWGERAGELSKVKPFLRRDAPNERAWLDFCDWYIGSMTKWAAFWLSETRKDYPRGDIYLCTGGHAPPEHGSDFGEQCRVAAESGAGVRITNEGSDYRANFGLTRWIASAGEQYGAYYSFEPAGAVDPHGVVARIYNATASGARGLHYYYPNLFGSEEARQSFIRFGGQLRQRRPIVEIAVYYPETHIKLNGNDFLPYVQPLRDRFDFDYISDDQIRDGGLKRYKALILLEGSTSEGWVWRRVAEWVRAGGLILYPEGMGALRSVEGDESYQAALIGPNAEIGRGRVVTFRGDGSASAYRDFLSRELSQARELSPGSRAMVSADGREDGVYVTLCAPRELLWLNYTAAAVQKGSRKLAPFSIESVSLPSN